MTKVEDAVQSATKILRAKENTEKRMVVAPAIKKNLEQNSATDKELLWEVAVMPFVELVCAISVDTKF